MNWVPYSLIAIAILFLVLGVAETIGNNPVLAGIYLILTFVNFLLAEVIQLKEELEK